MGGGEQEERRRIGEARVQDREIQTLRRGCASSERKRKKIDKEIGRYE